MIGFATLFLGIVMGARSIELTVARPVARVELLLDGSPAGAVAGPPWVHDIDFGPEPEPHDLVAVAYDAEGREAGRARQRINLPRSLAEAVLVLEPGNSGRGRVARLSWHSVVGATPTHVSVTFDGTPLAAPDPRRIEIPPHVPEQLHFLRAELDFPENLTAAAEITFGGRYAGETHSELTAVPVVLTEGKEPPRPEAMAGWFEAAGTKLRPVAVEEGPAEIVVVVDQGAREALALLDIEGESPSSAIERDAFRRMRRFRATLKKDQRVRFLQPVPEARFHSGILYLLFPRSNDYTSHDGGVPWLLNRTLSSAGKADAQRLADAVAVAGLSAAGRNRPRAVVLILASGTKNASELTPPNTLHYLDSLRVPFFLWTVGAPAEGPRETWGPGTDVSTMGRLESAVNTLSKAVARQRIVWVEGSLLSQRIVLSPDARGLALAR